MSEKQLIIKTVAGPFTLTEGPHWDESTNLLYFVDIPEQKFYCWNPKNNKLTHTSFNSPVGVAIPIANKKNAFVVGCGTNVLELTWDTSANNTNPITKVIASVDTDRDDTRINDGKIDAKGRFWFGTMGEKKEEIIYKRGSLYRMGSDGIPKKMVSPVCISNGLTWNHKNDTFYYIDSPTRQVVSYDYDYNTGDINNKHVIFDLNNHNIPGFPDGMTIDEGGNLWIAIYDGGRVIQVDPSNGNLLKTINLPATKITSVAFGGQNKDILYVTSAKQKLTNAELQEQPLAGSVFSIEGLDVKGTSMLAYKMTN
ncbi:regucalcin-like isoform X2 [Chelonus insularis]|uniref:regucalcin-like isoform X2 n=1 Tax=Chelonus insularis TaxID=460826 RepID=UPI001589A250|nr:regucalcin-like isoform X2 [Chelonus insularis]